MNKHKNRVFETYKSATGLEKNNTVRLVERDHMPVEVATELLAEPKNRLTNRQRKIYRQARWKCYESIFEPKPAEAVLVAKMKSKSWAQLVKWNNRAICRRADVQTAYLLAIRRRDKLQSETVDPKAAVENMRVQVQLAILNRAIAKLELTAAQLDMLWSAVDDEMTRRKKVCAGLLKLSAASAA